MTDVTQTIPILASLDIATSETFYVNKLGFKTSWNDGHYLIVRRNTIELHFWLTDNAAFPENTPCYIRGSQVADLYREFQAVGIDRLSDFSVKPWQMKEFYIHDPHGNLLRFGMETESA